MSAILIQPQQLRANAQTLRQKAKLVNSALVGIENFIRELNSLVFAGNRATALHSRFTQIHDELVAASALLVKFAQELELTADMFEKADNGTVHTLPYIKPITIPAKPDPGVVVSPSKTLYPVPPITHTLNPVDPSKYGDLGCARYAAARRPDLGSTQSNHEDFTDQAAANYISKYNTTAFQITAGTDLTNAIGKGYAVVWKPGVDGANATYGHVAIVEDVGKDYVIVSQAGWSTGTTMKIPINKLQDLWLIP